MKAWNDFWYGPVAAARPYVFLKGFLILIALDVWVTRLPLGANYGSGGFNVAHFWWLDRLQPLPTPALYVGLVSLTGLLALTMALTAVNRVGMWVLLLLYTYSWSMSWCCCVWRVFRARTATCSKRPRAISIS